MRSKQQWLNRLLQEDKRTYPGYLKSASRPIRTN